MYMDILSTKAKDDMLTDTVENWNSAVAAAQDLQEEDDCGWQYEAVRVGDRIAIEVKTEAGEPLGLLGGLL